MVVASERQIAIEDLSTGVPVMIPYLSGWTSLSLNSSIISSHNLMLVGLKKATMPLDIFGLSGFCSG